MHTCPVCIKCLKDVNVEHNDLSFVYHDGPAPVPGKSTHRALILVNINENVKKTHNALAPSQPSNLLCR